MATQALVDSFVMVLAAKLVGELCERFGQPVVVGELLVGMLLGPFALGWIGIPSAASIDELHGSGAAADTLNSIYEVLAQFGIIVLLFTVGLETRVSDIVRVGRRAAAVATVGTITSFVLVAGFLFVLGRPSAEAVFVGTALVATSIGISARVLADLGLLQREEARVILGAAIIDDILAMIALAIVSAVGTGGTSSLGSAALLVGEACVFAAVVGLGGSHVARRWGDQLDRLHIRNAHFGAASVLMLGLASLSAVLGLAAIIGAFLAGMVFAELGDEYELGREARPLYDLLVPLFFVVTGSHADWRMFFDGTTVAIALAVTALAMAGKVVGCGLPGVPGLGWRSAALVGVGMVPRGEVTLIVANVGSRLGAIPASAFSVLVIVIMLTTLFVPPALARLAASPVNGRGDETVSPTGHA